MHDNINQSSTIGIDGSVIDYSFGKTLVDKLNKKSIKVEMEGENLIDKIWTDRPRMRHVIVVDV